MNLYEIDNRLRLLEEFQCDPDTGELLDDEAWFNKYEEIQMDLQTKLENTACFIKELQAETDAIKAEEKKLAERRKTKENLIARLQNRIDNYVKFRLNNPDAEDYMESVNKWKMESARCKLSYRRSESVDVPDLDVIPKKFIKKKIELSADKTAIKEAIKSGLKVKGAEIKTNLSLQIK